PSPFSHEILNANPYAYLDDAPLEERRARAVAMRRVLPESVLQEVGKLDKTAIAEVQQQSWPDVRSFDELQDVLQTLIAFPEHRSWQAFFEKLVETGRAGIALINHKKFWLAAEKAKTFAAIYPTVATPTFIELEQRKPEREEAIVAM